MHICPRTAPSPPSLGEGHGLPPLWVWVWVPPPPCGCGCVGGGLENDKLCFHYAGVSGSRVNVYKSHHSVTETFSQRLKGKLRISSETVVRGGPYHGGGGGPKPCTLAHIYIYINIISKKSFLVLLLGRTNCHALLCVCSITATDVRMKKVCTKGSSAAQIQCS